MSKATVEYTMACHRSIMVRKILNLCISTIITQIFDAPSNSRRFFLFSRLRHKCGGNKNFLHPQPANTMLNKNSWKILKGDRKISCIIMNVWECLQTTQNYHRCDSIRWCFFIRGKMFGQGVVIFG